MMIGLGIGWQKEEYAAVGAPFRARGARLEECMLAMRALWTDSPATFHGEHVAFDRVFSNPQPTRGRVPILLGGNSAAAIDRVGRIGDGWLPFTIGPDKIASSVNASVKLPSLRDATPTRSGPRGPAVTTRANTTSTTSPVRDHGRRRLLFWPSITVDDLPGASLRGATRASGQQALRNVMGVRRVVTGVVDGRSRIIDDGPVPESQFWREL
jgi:hypothetical protein